MRDLLGSNAPFLACRVGWAHSCVISPSSFGSPTFLTPRIHSAYCVCGRSIRGWHPLGVWLKACDGGIPTMHRDAFAPFARATAPTARPFLRLSCHVIVLSLHFLRFFFPSREPWELHQTFDCVVCLCLTKLFFTHPKLRVLAPRA